MTTAAITAVLGGQKVFKRKFSGVTDLRTVTHDGLPAETLPALAEKLGVERKRLAAVVGISDRTLSRRMATGSRLSVHESDRTLRLARIVAKAEDTFGTSAKAAHWLQSPNLALGDDVPLDLLDTDAGAQQVQEVLYRIDYGMYS